MCLKKPWECLAARCGVAMVAAITPLLAEDAKKSGARVVFYLTWCRSFLPEAQPLLTDAYQAAGCARSASPGRT